MNLSKKPSDAKKISGIISKKLKDDKGKIKEGVDVVGLAKELGRRHLEKLTDESSEE